MFNFQKTLGLEIKFVHVDTNKQANRHIHIARGSAAEAITQIIISFEVGYIKKEEKDYFVDSFEHISSMLNKLIKSRKLVG